VGAVQQALVGGVGVHGGHLSVADAHGFVEDLRHRRQAVGRARGIGDDVVDRWVVDLVEVHAEDDVGVDRLGALARRREDDLARARPHVLLGVGAGAQAPRGLDDDVDVEVGPRQVAGGALTEHADLAPVERDDVAVARHLGRELPVDGVVGEEMREGGGIGDVVDGDDLQIGASLVGRAHEAAADAAEAVDGDAGGHAGSLIRRRYGEPTAAPNPRHPRSLRIAIGSSPPARPCERGARRGRRPRARGHAAAVKPADCGSSAG
jgi:hypothetical protein